MKIVVMLILAWSAALPAAVEPEYLSLFHRATRAMRRSMAKPVLAVVRAKRENLPGCEEFLTWTYVFQSLSNEAPAVGGFVQYTMAPTQSGCVRQERIVTDTALARLMGYNFLANNQNLNRVHVTWADTLANIQKKYPAFVWANAFEIYSPLVPGYSANVYYGVGGTLAGDPVQIVTDATTGEVF